MALCTAANAGKAPSRGRGLRAVRARRAGARAYAEQARRLRESERVEERARLVSTGAELDAALALAQDRLVIVEIFNDEVCDAGEAAYAAEPGVTGWADNREAHEAMLEPCRRLASTISRVARDAKECEFVLLDAGASAEAAQVAEQLGARVMPTVQFWKAGELLYQVNGATGAGQSVAEGAMYFGGAMADGQNVAELVDEISDEKEFDAWVAQCSMPGEGPGGVKLNMPCETQIGVLTVMGSKSKECMHAFPAVVALAKNSRGAVRWARCVADKDDATRRVAQRVGVSSAPQFVFFLEGQEVGRYAGADRVALMSAVIDVQRRHGIMLPSPSPRSQMSIAEASRIAREKRESDARRGVRPSGW